MLKTLRNAFKIPDLRKKLLFTLMMFVVIRLGANIPVPGVNSEAVKELFKQGGMFGIFDAISGGAFKNMSLFAMGIIPYINASIIMNLLTIAIPKLEEIQKDGDEGRKKIMKITRYLTVVLAAVQAFGTTIGFRGILKYPNAWSYIIAILTLTAGTAFLMWIGERITEKGIGNGISLIIFVNIISKGPEGIKGLLAYNRPVATALLVLIFIAVVAFVVLLQVGERRVSVQYAKKMVGRKMYGGQSTHIPLKVNTAGVIPIIFAMSLLTFPGIITKFFTQSPTGTWGSVLKWLSMSHWFGAILYVLLIVFFTYFYTSITFNPMDIANNMKKNGGFVPGIRPGKPTVDYLNKVLNYIVLVGAIGLALIAISPVILAKAFSMDNLSFGATSLLIVVGVALETFKQIEAQMLMRHYKGFLHS